MLAKDKHGCVELAPGRALARAPIMKPETRGSHLVGGATKPALLVFSLDAGRAEAR
jgi:hypothetical protein